MAKALARARIVSIATALVPLMQASCDTLREPPDPYAIDDANEDDDDEAADKRDAGKDAGKTGDAGVGGIDAGKDAGKKDSGAKQASLYCKAQAVLDAHCVRCHDGEGTEDAPMPLETFDDLMADAPSNPRESVFALVAARVHDRDAPMPPSGILRTAQLKDLDAWIEANAPNDAEDGCD